MDITKFKLKSDENLINNLFHHNALIFLKPIFIIRY